MKELALHILDIIENSVSAKADYIGLKLIKQGAELVITIEDNGRGMDQEELKKAQDPFYTSRKTRKVGLGIPLFRQHAEMTGGKLDIWSEENTGTRLSAVVYTDHPDVQPVGDIEGSWILLLNSYPGISFSLEAKTDTGEFSISSDEIKKVLGIERIEGSEILLQLKRLIRNNLDEIGLKG